jgi:hypothetical protein
MPQAYFVSHSRRLSESAYIETHIALLAAAVDSEGWIASKNMPRRVLNILQ